MKYCLIIPHYKHEVLFEKFLPKLVRLNLPCIVVDDGSGETGFEKIKQMLTSLPDFHLVRHQTNRGKGASVITGCYHASAMGFSHVIQLDADGQHDIEDVEKFIAYSKDHPSSFISGQPYFDETVPTVRKYGRRVSDFWTALETLSFKIKDGLCGFRLYPVKEIERVFDNYYLGPRMDFDPELLVKATWADIDVHFIPTKVIYHQDTVSHYHYLRDNLTQSRLHVRLMCGMIVRLPRILFMRVKSWFG
ncbi:glycosyltransferase family 2 protein [Alteromonas pelagimontana]|uniref:Glycosyltransferase family 2 protein n=1 Tax=Alteromonas pelagimontana TaxID=1858656 RepID=A0A6M4MCU0_9ALTE|nr:glycosyltransferase family 2 protein [Alteromonas pelagimontana]QJR80943.1 glycosyltransferase family 2 protein [Alteromonas pelagimontana]